MATQKTRISNLTYDPSLIKAGDTILLNGYSFKVWSVEGRFARIYWSDRSSNVVHARRVDLQKLVELTHTKK